MLDIPQIMMPSVIGLIIWMLTTWFHLRMIKKKIKYIFIMPIIFIIIGGLLLSSPYIFSLGWTGLTFIVFGLILIGVGLIILATSFVILYYVKKKNATDDTSHEMDRPKHIKDLNSKLVLLGKLNDLYKDGALSRDEFEQKKRDIIG